MGLHVVFALHFQGIRESSQAKNLLSAIQNPTIVDAKIAKELAARRLAGPFVSPQKITWEI